MNFAVSNTSFQHLLLYRLRGSTYDIGIAVNILLARLYRVPAVDTYPRLILNS